MFNRFKIPPSTGTFPKQKKLTLEFLERIKVQGPIIDIGASNNKARHDFFSIDLNCQKGVDIVADAHFLPLKNESVAGVHICAVLEHVENPFTVTKEIHRVVKIGGGVVAWVPFMSGYHKSPDDYYRFTVSGLKTIFAKFSEHRILIGPGAFSALSEIVRNCFAILCSFKSEFLYKLFCIIWGWIFLPIKYLDKIFSNPENQTLSNHSSAAGYLFFCKKT